MCVYLLHGTEEEGGVWWFWIIDRRYRDGYGEGIWVLIIQDLKIWKETKCKASSLSVFAGCWD